MRRNIFIVGLVIGIALAAYFYSDVFYLFTKSSARFKAVPVESGFFIDLKGLQTLRKTVDEQKLSDKLEPLQLFQRASQIKNFFSQFDTSSANPFLKDIETEHLLIASYPDKPGVTEFVYILEMNKASASDLQAWVGTNVNGVEADVRKVRGNRVYDLIFKDRTRWSVGIWHGLCIASTNTALVEESIVQLKGSSNFTDDISFEILNPSNDKAFLHLYINFQNLTSTVQGYADFHAYPYVQPLSRFTSWMALAFNPVNGGIAIQGKALNANNNIQALNNYSTVDEYKIWSLQQKPDNSSLIISTGVPAKPSKEPTAFYNAQDFQKYISPWLDGEISYVLVEPVDTSYRNQSLLFLRTKNSKSALSALQSLNVSSNDSLSRLPIRYKTFSINQLRESGLLENAMPNPFTEFSSPYYTVAGNYVVMSNSLTQLKLYLERFSDDKTLDKVNVSGMNTKSFARGSYNVYINLALLSDLFSLSARPDVKQSVITGLRAYGSFTPIYLQFIPTKNNFDIEGFISSGSTQVIAAKGNQYLWKTELDTTVITPPQPLGDGTGSEKQIAVQDANNTLYILNRSGDVMWRKQLDGPIQGKIHSIDFYKNDDRQLLFATSDKIYLLDQAGDDVQNFPINLPCHASTPLSVVDMDNDLNYKYFIGCNSGLIYGYEKGGKPLEGWNPNQLASDVTFPLQYLRYRSREFLLGITDDGWLKFFTRYGDQATKPLPIADRSANQFVSDEGKGYRSIANDGTEYRLGYDGKVAIIYSPIDGASDAIFADVSSSTQGFEKIIFDGKRLGVFSGDTTKIQTMNLPSGVNGKLFTAKTSDKYYIGVAGNSKIWLMDSDGKMVSGFPRSGRDKFIGTDLYNNDQLVLIGLVDDHTVIAYAVE